MKILLIADPFIPVPPINYGGIERIIYLLASGLLENNYSITLIAHKESKIDSRIKLVKYSVEKDRVIENTALVYKTFKSDKYDIVHSFARLMYLLPLCFYRIPKVMSYQREPTLSQIKKANFIAYKNTLVYTGCSAYISNQINDIADARPIYNMVDPNQYDFVEEVSSDAPLVFLGRIEEIKGVHTAIEIAKSTNHKLIIAGNIPKESNVYFKSKVEPYIDNDQIVYIGEVNDTQKNILLKNSKALLMPIQWNEPFGIVMIEAMACGTPVIAMNRGAVNEVVMNDLNGFKCESLSEMVEAVNRISSISRREVYSDFLNRFSRDIIVEQYVNLYKELISKNVS